MARGEVADRFGIDEEFQRASQGGWARSECSAWLSWCVLTRVPQGMFVKFIQSETGTRVQIKGIGSGFYENETGAEAQEPMHISIA
jgi:hypothetical protein